MNFVLSLNEFLRFLPVFIRCAAIILSIPVFSTMIIPNIARISLPLWFSIAIYRTVEVPAISQNLPELILGVVGEVTLGMLFYTLVRIFFIPPQVSGEIISFQMGFGIGGAISPAADIPLTLVADFLYLMGLLLFFLLDVHHFFFVGLQKSFEVIPPFFVGYSESAHKVLITSFGESLEIAVRLASPVLVPLFLIEVSMALVAKTVPQINIFVVGLPLRVLLGLITMTTFLPLMSFIMGEWIKEMGKTSIKLIQILK